jgi:hypothetical protein
MVVLATSPGGAVSGRYMVFAASSDTRRALNISINIFDASTLLEAWSEKALKNAASFFFEPNMRLLYGTSAVVVVTIA